ncbi:MAG: hypothetical protein IT538_05045 [Variibacter sp.]|nr:hypothetical protein [Variibacter sp.]
MFRADSYWWSNSSPAPRRAASVDALVSADGQCPAGDPPAGVAIGMTECDLVRIAGSTNQIAFAQNERGERTVVMTYPQGERAGVYHFASGLLQSMDRVDPPPTAKPRRPARKPPPQRPRREPPPPPRGY